MAGTKHISIIGAGWLGKPLALAYRSKQWVIQATRTTSTGVHDLIQHGINAEQLVISEARHDPIDKAYRITGKTCVITLPFRRSFSDPTAYLNQMKNLYDALCQSPAEHVIFTSSTSVYTPNNGIVDEYTVIEPVTDRQSVLLAVEDFFLTTLPIPATVIRFGGLYGPNREKKKFLAPNSPGGLTPVNTIHLTDCIGLMQAIIATPEITKQKIYNAVHPTFTPKTEFYGLPLQLNVTPHKRVLANRITRDLGYIFQVDPVSGTP